MNKRIIFYQLNCTTNNTYIYNVKQNIHTYIQTYTRVDNVTMKAF